MAGFAVPLSRWFSQGQVAAGAKIYVYQSGTTTPVTLYSDSGLTTPVTNPVTCDSNGEAVFFVADSQLLRFYVTTSGGTLIRDVDPVYPIPNLANSSLTLNAHGQCRLTKSGSNLLLSPYNGNRLVINGQGQTIPSSGVTLAPSALSTNTLYYIYAYMSGSTMVLEASATGHSTDSSTGVEIKTGDATRTLVGMARTITGPAWADTAAQRFVLSYFNRRPIYGTNAFTANRTRSVTSFAELNSEIRNEFLCWADTAVKFMANGSFQIATSGQGSQSAIGIDGTTAEDCITNAAATANNGIFPLAISHATTLSEGYHYATLLGLAEAGGTTWYGASAGSLRCTLKTVVMG